MTVDMRQYVSLHNHTDFSLLRSTSRIRDFVARASELGMPALAVTDDGNLFGALEFYKACAAASVQPIIGCDFFLAPDSRHLRTAPPGDLHSSRLVLLAKSDRGYRNLIRLSSAGYTEGFYCHPRIDDEHLTRYAEELVCLSGSWSGDISRSLLANQTQKAEERACFYRDLFGRDSFYLELNDHELPEQPSLNQALVDLASRIGVRTVAANESYYVRQGDANAHDTLLCIGGGKRKNDKSRFRFLTDEFYLKSQDEICRSLGDFPEAIMNTFQVAEQCKLHLVFPGPMLPDVEIPKSFEGPAAYLRHLATEGLAARYAGTTERIGNRLNYELDTIIDLGFAGYFLIVWDYVRYARENGIPVGPGRGSAGGSLVAYTLQITGIDPLKHGLLFERFLNPDRPGMPDFDIDFCSERRGEVIDYVTRKYREGRVGQIITFGTMKARAVIRDVARALDIPPGETDAIAKLLPMNPRITLQKAMEQVPEFAEVAGRGEIYAELMDTSMKLEGLHRRASTHAAGIVIGRDELVEYVPLWRDARTGRIATQYTMDYLEECGLVKMDFLGLRTLTVIENTRKLLHAQGIEIDLDAIPDDDPSTFELLSRGQTRCVFQFESSGMVAFLKRLKPSRLEHLIALSAMYRPGPMDDIDRFIDAKNGRTPITYPIRRLASVLKVTYGLVVYQEQILEILQLVAGFSLGQADFVRRALGKKHAEEIARMKDSYLDGAAAHGVSTRDAQAIFTLLEQFAGCAFNKSHAAAYTLLGYRTAYLKAHHPVEFMAANLTAEINNPDMFADCMQETEDMPIEVIPPDVNISEKFFAVLDGKIVYGLAGIQRVPRAAIDEILGKRSSGGPFRSFADFLQRVDTRIVNRKVARTLVECGVFDSLGESRSILLDELDNPPEHE